MRRHRLAPNPCPTCGTRDHVECCRICSTRVPAKRRGLATCCLACEQAPIKPATERGLQWSGGRGEGGRWFYGARYGDLVCSIRKTRVERGTGLEWRWRVERQRHVEGRSTIEILACGVEHGNALERAQRRATEEALRAATPGEHAEAFRREAFYPGPVVRE